MFGELPEVVVSSFQNLEEVFPLLAPEVVDIVYYDVGEPVHFSFQVGIPCVSSFCPNAVPLSYFIFYSRGSRQYCCSFAFVSVVLSLLADVMCLLLSGPMFLVVAYCVRM